MAVFRKIHTKFWSDPFIQSLSPEKKYFFLYLLTNEQTKQCGIYEITKKQISHDTGYNTDTVSILLAYFISEKKIAYSERSNEIAILNWKKYNENESPKVKKLVDQELRLVKDQKLVQYLYSMNTVSIQYRQEEEEKEQEKEQKKLPEIGIEKVREIANSVWEDQAWKETMCMGLQINMEQLQRWMAQFNASVSGDKIPDFDKSKYKKMIRGWISSQQAKGYKVETGIDKQSAAPPLKVIT